MTTSTRQASYRALTAVFAVAVGCLLLFTVTGCRKKQATQSANEKVIARVYDRFLTINEIRNIVPKGTSHSDSITIIRNYVQNWVRQQVVLKKAEDNLDDEQKDVSRQLEEYKNSLLTFSYERELIRQNLDTAISDAEIEKYYNEHQNNFQLKDNIVKVLYVRLPKNAPKLDRVRNWYKSDNARDRKQLEEYCFQFAKDYYLADEEWMPFSDLLKKVPVSTYDQEQFLRNNRFIEIPDSNTVYLVNIKGFKIKESLSPLSFERDNIRNLIINKRKLDLISELEKAAYENAIKENEVEIWLPKK